MSKCSRCGRNLAYIDSVIEESGRPYCSHQCTPSGVRQVAAQISDSKRGSGHSGYLNDEPLNFMERYILMRMFRFGLMGIGLLFTMSVWVLLGGISMLVTEGVSSFSIILLVCGSALTCLSVILIERLRRG